MFRDDEKRSFYIQHWFEWYPGIDGDLAKRCDGEDRPCLIFYDPYLISMGDLEKSTGGACRPGAEDQIPMIGLSWLGSPEGLSVVNRVKAFRDARFRMYGIILGFSSRDIRTIREAPIWVLTSEEMVRAAVWQAEHPRSPEATSSDPLPDPSQADPHVFHEEGRRGVGRKHQGWHLVRS